jgi:hypothetical protein
VVVVLTLTGRRASRSPYELLRKRTNREHTWAWGRWWALVMKKEGWKEERYPKEASQPFNILRKFCKIICNQDTMEERKNRGSREDLETGFKQQFQDLSIVLKTNFQSFSNIIVLVLI